MNKKLPHYFIVLTQDTCLHAFWRKDSLRTFLAQNGIKQNFLSTWGQDETKANFLRRLFMKLVEDKSLMGHKAIFMISASLVEMKSFPDLHGWQDSDEKISKAYRAVEKLKLEYERICDELRNAEFKKEKQQQAREEREKMQYSCQTLEKFQTQLVELMKSIGNQQAGYDFEKWFYEFAIFHDISSSPPYKDKNGRQIDGSITIDGTTFLVETKFTRNPLGAPDIDIFESKVRRKADNTMGLMISINGFTTEAIKAASCDRTLLILMDGGWFFNVIFMQKMNLKEAIQNILIHASRTGNSYLPINNY